LRCSPITMQDLYCTHPHHWARPRKQGRLWWWDAQVLRDTYKRSQYASIRDGLDLRCSPITMQDLYCTHPHHWARPRKQGRLWWWDAQVLRDTCKRSQYASIRAHGFRAWSYFRTAHWHPPRIDSTTSAEIRLLFQSAILVWTAVSSCFTVTKATKRESHIWYLYGMMAHPPAWTQLGCDPPIGFR